MLLMIFHIVLPQLVLRAIASKSEKVLNLSLASMLDQSVAEHSFDLPLRDITGNLAVA